MKSVCGIALGAALALGGSTIAALAPASAQDVPTLSSGERSALEALNSALTARDYATAAGAVNAAQSAARSGYGRYLASALQLRLGRETANLGLQSSAIDAMIESGAAPAAALPQLYRAQGSIALGAGDFKKAEAAFSRLLETAPGDAEALLALSEAKDRLRKPQEAAVLVDRAIAARRATGLPVPESWYKRGLKHAYDNKVAPESLKLGRELVAAYPRPENWRDTLLIYSELAPADPAAKLDAMRLMRSAKALSGERDYQELAEALSAAGLPGESKAVLDEGVAAKMIDPAKPAFKTLISSINKRAASDRALLKGQETKAMAAATGTAALASGDSHFGFGQYEKAAALYRAAVQKGSVDPDVSNTRLGMALALAGQRTEAEAALRSVTGPRAELASLWLVWLAQRA